MANKVVVVGSYNTDMTIATQRIPRPGETVLGGSFAMHDGGKGANQAVAAARAGAQVWLVARVGDDELGQAARARLEAEHVNCDFVVRDPHSRTGTAFIIVDEDGENSIVVASGANMHLQPEDVEAATSVIAGADMLLMQLETPPETVMSAANLAAGRGVPVMLNPAPARTLPGELLRRLTLITPNAVETEMLTGMRPSDERNARAAAEVLRARGVGTVLITLGAQGVYAAHQGEYFRVPAFPVQAVDTTAAGDVFCGALCAFWGTAATMWDTVSAACAAAALSVTRPGAMGSAPLLPEIQRFLRDNHALEV